LKTDKKKLLLGITIVLTGLSAGLLYAYSVSINNAFVNLTDTQYVAAMQNINIAIQNPIFFLSFLGAAVALPLSAYKFRKTTVFKPLVLAAGLYVIGTLGVTMAINVPLNDKLAAFKLDAATAQQVTAARADYVGPWNSWHTVRTLAAIAAFATVTAAGLMSVEEAKRGGRSL